MLNFLHNKRNTNLVWVTSFYLTYWLKSKYVVEYPVDVTMRKKLFHVLLEGG